MENIRENWGKKQGSPLLPFSPLSIHSIIWGRNKRYRELIYPPQFLGHALVHTRSLFPFISLLFISFFLLFPDSTYFPPHYRCFRLGFLEAELETEILVQWFIKKELSRNTG